MASPAKVNINGINELDFVGSTGAAITAALSAPGVVTVTVPTAGGGSASRGPLQNNAQGWWWVWSDGVIEQFGSVTLPASTTFVSEIGVAFPVSFVTQVFSVCAVTTSLPRFATSQDTADVAFTDVNISGGVMVGQCSVPTGGGGATFDSPVTVNWRAIGI